MGDRWDLRVREIGRIEAPVERMWDRVLDGPRRPERPPTRPRASLLVASLGVLALVFLAWFGLQPRSRLPHAAGGTEAVVRIETPAATGAEPSAWFSNGSDSVTAELDEYLWRGESHPGKFPPTIDAYLPVIHGTTLEVTGDDRPDRTWVFLARPGDLSGMDGSAGTLGDVAGSIFDVEPGEYVLVVQQSWGCHFESPGATACFQTNPNPNDESLLTFYFGVRIIAS